MRTLLAAWLLLALAQGCATAPAGDESARAAYRAIEDRLLSAAVLRVNYRIEARGAVSARIDGDLVMQKPALAAIGASGLFAGDEVAPVLVANDSQVRGGSGAARFAQSAPPQLRDGLLLGLTRMGILHNLANLSQGAPPDGTDGSVRDWVVANGFAWKAGSGGRAQLRGIGFSIEVGGEPAGEVVLWYDPESGLPVEREQVVHFGTGDMHVSERYAIETGGVIGPCRFDPDTVALFTD